MLLLLSYYYVSFLQNPYSEHKEYVILQVLDMLADYTKPEVDLPEQTRQIIGTRPNTYTFTKVQDSQDPALCVHIHQGTGFTGPGLMHAHSPRYRTHKSRPNAYSFTKVHEDSQDPALCVHIHQGTQIKNRNRLFFCRRGVYPSLHLEVF